MTINEARTESVGGRLLRIEDIADRLCVSRSMSWKLIAIGAIRSIRVGRAVRVRPADLEAYIEQASRQS